MALLDYDNERKLYDDSEVNIDRIVMQVVGE